MTQDSHNTNEDLLVELERLRTRNDELELLIRRDTAEHEITALALQESEQSHRTYVENAPHAIFVVDSQRRFVDVNRAACRMTGYSRPELLGMFTSQVISKVGPADSGPAFESLQQTGNLQVERTIRRKDGSTFAVLLNAVALQADRFMAFCTDITARKQAEEELRESRRQYEMLFNEMPNGYCLHEIICDENDVPVNYRYLEINPAFEAQSGLRGADIVGKTVLDVLPDIEPSWIERYGRVALTGEPIEFERYLRPLERYYSFKAFRPRERQFAVMFNDITEQKRTESALLREKRQSEEYINSLPGLFYVFDEHRFVRWNKQWREVTGYTDEELASMYGPDFFEGDDRALIGERMKEVFRVGSSDAEAELVTKDGRRIPYYFSGSHKRLDGKDYLVGLGIDITERREAERERRELEAQVRQAQKLDSLGILAGGIAHDFNNLLMGVLGNAELALTELPPESAVRADIENVRRAATRASELANQMLAYSGRGQFVVKSVCLSSVIEEMGQLIEAAVPKTAVLKYQLDQSLPPIEADVTQIRQVVLNLITNACEALEEKSGVIEVVTGVVECDRAYLTEYGMSAEYPEGRYVFLEVSDPGKGMDADTVTRIFDPFFTTKFTGRGLGLAAVFGIVRGHKGAIKVDSVPNEGTTVRTLFPVTGKPVESFDDSGEVETLQGGGETVLLVDDEPGVLDVGARMLERAGYAVKTARDGVEAVKVFQQHKDEIDCVLLDLTMPVMGGEETFVMIRSISSDVPVLLSSGYSDVEMEGRISKDGFAGFIKKPYRLNELNKTIRQAISQYSA